MARMGTRSTPMITLDTGMYLAATCRAPTQDTEGTQHRPPQADMEALAQLPWCTPLCACALCGPEWPGPPMQSQCRGGEGVAGSIRVFAPAAILPGRRGLVVAVTFRNWYFLFSCTSLKAARDR